MGEAGRLSERPAIPHLDCLKKREAIDEDTESGDAKNAKRERCQGRRKTGDTSSSPADDHGKIAGVTTVP